MISVPEWTEKLFSTLLNHKEFSREKGIPGKTNVKKAKWLSCEKGLQIAEKREKEEEVTAKEKGKIYTFK